MNSSSMDSLQSADLTVTIRQELGEARRLLDTFLADEAQLAQIETAARLMSQSIRAGGKILSCGNGGSHCDAMHFAEELTGRYRRSRRPLPALCISDSSHLSCVGNDFGYEQVFSRFVEALGRPEDVLLAISTSGRSESILRAVQAAKATGMKVVILTGKEGGQLKGMGEAEIRVPYSGYADRIQEIHIKIIHCLILSVEQLLGV